MCYAAQQGLLGTKVYNAIVAINELIADHATNKTTIDECRTAIIELIDDHATFKTCVDAMETAVEELMDDHATQKTSHDAMETLIEELHDDHATFKTVVDDLKTLANALRTYLADGMLVHGTLAIDAVPEKFKTTTAAAYTISGVNYAKSATTALTFTTGHVITASKFGIILVQINAAGTIATKVSGATQAYDDAAAALAALPSADTGYTALGYIAIENNAGDWTANTDDLTDGSDVTTAAFSNTTVKSIPSAVSSSSPATLTATKPASGPATLTATKPASAPATLTAGDPTASAATLTATTISNLA